MGLTTADSYYLKAKAATSGFCSDWGEVCEALNYALSYDENHCASLCFLGEIYADKLSQYKNAFECFDRIIAFDSDYTNVYPIYIKYLIWTEEIDRAEKLIEFAKTVKGVDISQLFWLKAYLEDVRGNYKLSLQFLNKAKINIYNDYYFDFMDDEKRRIKKKINLIQDNKKLKHKVSSSKKSKKSKEKKK